MTPSSSSSSSSCPPVSSSDCPPFRLLYRIPRLTTPHYLRCLEQLHSRHSLEAQATSRFLKMQQQQRVEQDSSLQVEGGLVGHVGLSYHQRVALAQQLQECGRGHQCQGGFCLHCMVAFWSDESEEEDSTAEEEEGRQRQFGCCDRGEVCAAAVRHHFRVFGGGNITVISGRRRVVVLRTKKKDLKAKLQVAIVAS
eukprot:GHVS01037532.1.p1 GENE.GHVS01037532.1~~GHVS01037532.1.p1  ORF type:complete len:226 (-),score=95.61 GHVS01037532.1:210-797(-)